MVDCMGFWMCASTWIVLKKLTKHPGCMGKGYGLKGGEGYKIVPKTSAKLSSSFLATFYLSLRVRLRQMLVLGKCFSVYFAVFVTAIAAAKGKNKCLTCALGSLQECVLVEFPVMFIIIKNINLDFCICHLCYNSRISRKKQPKFQLYAKPRSALLQLEDTITIQKLFHSEPFFLFTVIHFLFLWRKHCKTRSLKQNLWLPQLPSMTTETPWSVRKISELLVWKCMIFHKTVAEERATGKDRFNLKTM